MARLPVFNKIGQSLVELLMVIGLAALLMPAVFIGYFSSREGRAQQKQRLLASSLLKETTEETKNVQEHGWSYIAPTGTYHPVVSGSTISLVSGSTGVNGFTQQVAVADVYRDSNGVIVLSPTPGILDPSSKKITTTISWTNPISSSINDVTYLTRYMDNLSYTQTTAADFNTGTLLGTQVTNTAGGEVILGNNNYAKWCSPSLSSATIDLPDGPPVAVAATASATTNTIPNDVFVATAPNDSTSIKLAYLNVTANTDPPVPSLQGIFTLDPTQYSAPGLVPTGINLTNTFKTNDVKYYTSASGKLYALLATDLPDHEIIAIQIKSGGANSFQDPTKKIYKYWTFFNTRQYQGDNRSTPNQDQAPFGYGAVNITILGSRGYTISGGYMYVFDLSNIDSKTPTTGLDMVGCRIELDGYDCQPNNGTDMKYNAGQTGGSWSNTTPPAHNSCSDGGNIELYADHQLSVVQVGASTYIYVAVGAGTNPELDIVNATTVPTNSTSPKINNNNCGTISSGNSSWHEISSLDFNTKSNSEEAANSVFAKSDGTRAYMSSNGGIDANNDGIPDSDQFYVIDTSNKSSPKFLSGTSSTGATSGYYNGNSTNIELFPRRSLTVLNGQRAILVGQDGTPNDGIEPQEYQVLNISTEASPAYCGGINFIAGFNDLTSVSEADGDNFVYMVANTMEKQLKIIQGGPDVGIYVSSGTYESATFDATSSTAFNRFSATVNQPTNTTINMQLAVAPPVSGSCVGANFTYIGPDGTAGTSFSPTGTVIAAQIPYGSYSTNYQNPNRCFRYKTFLSTTDNNKTPTLYDMSANYSP